MVCLPVVVSRKMEKKGKRKKVYEATRDGRGQSGVGFRKKKRNRCEGKEKQTTGLGGQEIDNHTVT